MIYILESVQAAEGVRVSCRSSLNCSESSDDEIGIMTARECCVENSNGLAFTTTSQQSETHVCTACIGEYMQTRTMTILYTCYKIM